MPPEYLTLDDKVIEQIARANVALGLADQQPAVFGWEADAPQYATAAAGHEGLSNGLFKGAAGQTLADKPAIVLNLGMEAHA